MSKNINLVKTDIGNLFKQLESVAKESKVEEKKRKDYVETTETDLSSLFQGLEEVSKQTKKINPEDEQKLSELSDMFEKLDEEYPEDLPSDVEPEPEEKEYEEAPEDNPIDDVSQKVVDWIEPVKEEPKPKGIVKEVLDSLGDMRYNTEIKEELSDIEKLRKEFDSFKRKIARDLSSSSGGGAASFLDLDDVENNTAAVDGKFLRFSSSSNKFVGSDAEGANDGIQLENNAGSFIVLDTAEDENDQLIFEDGTSDPIAVLASHGITLSGQGWNAFRFENP